MVPGRRFVLLALASLVGTAFLPVTASPVAASVPSLPSGCVQAPGTGHITCTFAYTGDSRPSRCHPGCPTSVSWPWTRAARCTSSRSPRQVVEEQT